jgi:SHS family lactate transporter-like MFS transporter
MASGVAVGSSVPWWKEPTKDQWLAYVAAWLGWTLDAFDFTIFLLIMVPIAKEFNVPITEVTVVFTVTLWMRLLGATAAGWMADRMGRKTPLMISIIWYSACNFIAGFSPTFWFLFLFRALLGIGMGAEWPAGAALAMEQWPIRSRGFMSGVLQGSWGLGFMMSSLAYGALFDKIGWRGLLMLGVLPALSVVYVRFFVKEPEVWKENQKLQRAEQREVHAPLVKIFKRGMLLNTATSCWWMASSFIVYYAINSLFATHLQKDLGFSPGAVATPIFWSNLLVFLSMGFWGWCADRIGRRWAMIIPALIAIPIAPLYLLTSNLTLIIFAFVLQGAFGGGIYGQNPSYLNERFPTEVRATAAGFCYHQGAIFAGILAPVLSYFAVDLGYGFAWPMLIATVGGCISFVLALLWAPETHGKEMTAELVVA